MNEIHHQKEISKSDILTQRKTKKRLLADTQELRKKMKSNIESTILIRNDRK